MADEKIYHPEEIPDAPFPQDEQAGAVVSQPSGSGVYTPQTIKERSFPTKRIAIELISTSLNTKSKKILAEFELAPSGALQIGKYENGVSGDLRITANGITARDSVGNTTFSIDGANGDAVFRGTIQGETLIAEDVIVGDNHIIIDGKNKRIIVNDGTHDRVLIGYDEGGF